MKPWIGLALTASIAAVCAPSVAVAQDPIESELIATGPDEQALKQTIVLDTDLASAWAYFTDPEMIARWMAPVAEVDLTTGGAILTNYDACARIGDGATITLKIINFVPQRMLTLQSDLEPQREASWMNEQIFERRERLYNVIEFAALDDGRTQITSWGLGYGSSKEWETMIGFFIAGNEWTFGQLHKAIAGEVVYEGCASEAG